MATDKNPPGLKKAAEQFFANEPKCRFCHVAEDGTVFHTEEQAAVYVQQHGFDVMFKFDNPAFAQKEVAAAESNKQK